MTTANREKVYACDYCGSDYTDAKYCCAARREYLNAHGEFETGRAPAASVGDAEADRKDAAIQWAQGLIKQLPRDHDGRNSWLLNHGIGEESDWLRAEYARHRAAWKEWREGMPQPEMRKYAAALSVPATEDKAPAVDAEPRYKREGDYMIVAYSELRPTDYPDVWDHRIWSLPPGMAVPDGCEPLYQRLKTTRSESMRQCSEQLDRMLDVATKRNAATSPHDVEG